MTYPQWTPKPVADVIDAFDKEKIALGRTLGLDLVPRTGNSQDGMVHVVRLYMKR